MKTELERAAHYLDEALISLSAGRTDAACVHMHHAAAILEVTAAAAQKTTEPTETKPKEEAPKVMAMAA